MNDEWRPIAEPPEKSGYVLLAAYHHRTIPRVLYGFCKVTDEGARFSPERYVSGIVITHWMPLPKHPVRTRGGDE